MSGHPFKIPNYMFAIKRVHVKECVSTQDEALKQIPSLKKGEILVLDTDHQTGGRGRQNRKWVSSEGKGLLVTFAFKVENPASITQLLALSVCHVLNKLGFHTQIKWPNDLILNTKKLGGILAEVKEGWVILGLGLNINSDQEDLDINRPATSLKIEGETVQDKITILDQITHHFVDALSLYEKEGFTPFETLYSRYLIHKMGDMLVINGISYPFEGVNKDGSLKAGKKTFYSAEITS